MWNINASCGIIALAIVAAGCATHETTMIRRETVRTVPANPVVVEKTTTETTESDD